MTELNAGTLYLITPCITACVLHPSSLPLAYLGLLPITASLRACNAPMPAGASAMVAHQYMPNIKQASLPRDPAAAVQPGATIPQRTAEGDYAWSLASACICICTLAFTHVHVDMHAVGSTCCVRWHRACIALTHQYQHWLFHIPGAERGPENGEDLYLLPTQVKYALMSGRIAA